ncbi:MAG: FapA family protein [Lachnospiraceae bacterium]|nr:FapA family protein [Lachnospiraceae bacterium]
MLETTEQKVLGEIDISTSEDGMKAFLCLSPDDKNKTYELNHLKSLLREAGIEYGIQEDVLHQMIEQKQYFTKVLVAQGNPAQDGKDGSYEFLFPVDIDTRPKILKDGSVDYAAAGQIPSVEEGQDIVYYHPAENGMDGMDVFGGLLVGKNGKDLARLRGRGFVVSEDNLVYTSRTTGKITYINNVLNIDKELTISGDVSYTTTGNINFVNDIHICGNVLTGMKVVSEKGSITVDGYVEAAVLVAKKDIILKNGMQGNGQGKIATAGSVSGKFFEQTHIDCDGDVCANAIMNCYINSGQDVKVSGKFGAIIGGRVCAMRSIDSMIVSNMAQVRTELSAGIEADLFTLLTQQESTQQKLQSEIETILEALKKINAFLENESREDLQKKKMQLTRAKIEKDSRINEVIKQKQLTLEKMAKANEAKVSIRKRVYPGTSITINGMRVLIKEEIENVEYARRGSGIISYNIE